MIRYEYIFNIFNYLIIIIVFMEGIIFYRRGYTVKCFFQGISWNANFTIVSLFHYRQIFMIYFLNPVMKYQNSENRFSEFSVSWNTFLLNLFSCLINSFIINNVCENLKENVNISKKVLLNILQNSQENTCTRLSSLIKLQGWGLQLYLKRDSATGVFLWILRNF